MALHRNSSRVMGGARMIARSRTGGSGMPWMATPPDTARDPRQAISGAAASKGAMVGCFEQSSSTWMARSAIHECRSHRFSARPAPRYSREISPLRKTLCKRRGAKLSNSRDRQQRRRAFWMLSGVAVRSMLMWGWWRGAPMSSMRAGREPRGMHKGRWDSSMCLENAFRSVS